MRASDTEVDTGYVYPEQIHRVEPVNGGKGQMGIQWRVAPQIVADLGEQLGGSIC